MTMTPQAGWSAAPDTVTAIARKQSGFRWDSRDQLTGYCSAQGEQWEYPPRTPAADEQRNAATGRKSASRICGTATVLRNPGIPAMINLYSVRHLVFNGFELISPAVQPGTAGASVGGPAVGDTDESCGERPDGPSADAL
ncbi:putative truncated Rhs core protein [Escherichia coli]|uniref:Putative truncated Rhs core protein n=1 Tax=Escherichia coli TaxID=562 RepID=A0A376MT10_ECOLX|nr:putative truncated Rhs core protein [Escherichia coli]